MLFLKKKPPPGKLGDGGKANQPAEAVLEHFGNGFGDVFHIAGVESADADAAVFNGINAVVGGQFFNLFGSQSCKGEHAGLARHEAEVALGAETSHFIGQSLTHRADAFTHAAEFLLPVSVFLRIVILRFFNHEGD